VLQWLHANDCPWSMEAVVTVAYQKGQLHVLHWLRTAVYRELKEAGEREGRRLCSFEGYIRTPWM
jgi:hypothetical protein